MLVWKTLYVNIMTGYFKEMKTVKMHSQKGRAEVKLLFQNNLQSFVQE